MSGPLSPLCLLLVLAFPSVPSDSEASAAFPSATPQSQGVSPEGLQLVADQVQAFVEEGKIVGAELLVIRNRHAVFHRTFGWKDREDLAPMRRHTLFNVRSMTKPVTGTAAMILADEGRLALEDPVAKHLPSFDNERSRGITVEHLITHRSGLPLTLLTQELREDQTLRQIADQAGAHGPEFEPGTRFLYSDAGSDTLGAVIEVVSGMSLDAFVRSRILEPLGMEASIALLSRDDARSGRIASAYVGGPGSWQKYWSPRSPRLYPFAMGSQSLYASPMDYARFLALWMDGGAAGNREILSEGAVGKALTPVSGMKYPSGFPGLEARYGRMWQLWVAEAEGGAPRVVVFGHGGSDGTWAWVWPARDLMILYFTQSRGQGTGIALENSIHANVVHPGGETHEVPDDVAACAGPYIDPVVPWHGGEYTIVLQGGRLALQLPNQAVLDLNDPDADGRRALALDPRVAVSFDRTDAGEVIAMVLHQPDRSFRMPRGSAPEAPEIKESEVDRFLGFYDVPEEGVQVEMVLKGGRLAVIKPGVPVPLEFWPPDDEGWWRLRLNSAVRVRFNRDEAGRVLSYTAAGPAGEADRPRAAAANEG